MVDGAADGAPESDDTKDDGGHARAAHVAGARITIGQLAHGGGFGDDLVKPILIHLIVQSPVAQGIGDIAKGFALEGEVLGEGFGLGLEGRHRADFGDQMANGRGL